MTDYPHESAERSAAITRDDGRDIIFDEHGAAWIASAPKPSTMSRVIEVQRRGAAVLEHEQYPSVMTRRMVRPATRDEVEEWRAWQ